MSQQGKIRLAPGGLTTREMEIKTTRNHVLIAVAKHCPKVLDDLASDVLPIYCMLAEQAAVSADPKAWAHIMSRWHTVGAARPDLWPELLPLADALRAWARDSSLEFDWVFNPALLALSLWCENPSLRQYRDSWLGLGAAWRPPISSSEARLTLEYDCSGETGSDFEKRMLSRIREHRQRVEKLAQEAGEWYPARQVKPEHFKWLVLRQVDGLPWSKIAGGKAPTASAVKQAVEALAGQAEMQLRTIPHGRPRK